MHRSALLVMLLLALLLTSGLSMAAAVVGVSHWPSEQATCSMTDDEVSGVTLACRYGPAPTPVR